MNEVLVTIDASTGNDNRRDILRRWLDELAESNDKIRVTDADYSLERRCAVAKRYFGLNAISKRTYRGPFYSHFEAIEIAKYNYVFHVDCDVLLGGRSRTWVAEALDLLSADETLLTVSPLPQRAPLHQQIRGLIGCPALHYPKT